MRAAERHVIGLDLSLTGTGLAAAGRVEVSPNLGPSTTLPGRWARIDATRSWVVNRLHGTNPLIVVEGASYNSKGGQSHERAGLWWAVVGRCFELDLDVVEVPPATLKKFATGRGNASKPDMRLAWYKRAGVDLADDNAVDAAWLCQIGLHLTGRPDAIVLPKAHTDALQRLRVA